MHTFEEKPRQRRSGLVLRNSKFIKEMKNSFRTVLWLLVGAISLLLAACGGGEQRTAYNRFVEAYTSGLVPRSSTVSVVLSQDVPEERIGKVDLQELLTISPGVKGRVAFADSRTIVFSPDRGLDRDTKYSATLNVSDLFDNVADAESRFSFGFFTLPTSFSGSLESFEETTDGHYEVTFCVTSLDAEEAQFVEKQVTPSEGKPLWQHSSDGCRHILKVEAEAGATSRMLKVNHVGKVIAEAEIPAKGEMRVMGVRSKTEDQKYVEVTFSKRLDDKQDMMGLAVLEDNQSEAVDVCGNTLRLYPDAGRDGKVTVVLAAAIRSASGLTLGEDQRVEVELDATKPAVEFLSGGVIIPLTDNVTVPFRSIFMRGVRVRVFRVFANNVGLMMRDGRLGESDRLARYGMPVAVSTIFLDGQGLDLTRWNTFAIDISKLVKAEPGALYRIELQMPYELSAWPAANTGTADRAAIAKADEAMLAKLRDSFSKEGGWYYANDDIDWDSYDWTKADNPDCSSYYARKTEGRNVFATNIGLTALAGDGGHMTIVALNLPDAQPLSGVDVSVMSYQGQQIGHGSTDTDGKAEISIDRAAGKPLYVMASRGGDVSYLRVGEGEGLSTSVFDVAGQEPQAGDVKGFIYGERGVWRPGDDIHLGFMLQDRGKTLPDGHPVTLEVYTPLGQLAAKKTQTVGSMGLYSFCVNTDADAPTGSWRACVRVGGASFEKRLRVETIKPNRLKIDVGLPPLLGYGEARPVKLHAEWLSGAKAGSLGYEVTAALAQSVTAWDKWSGYAFDDPSARFAPEETQIAKGVTNADGDATVSVLPKVGGKAPGMLRMMLTTRVFEPSGEFSVDSRMTTFSPYARYAGVKSPQAGPKPLETDKRHSFSVVSVSPDGQPQAGVKLNVSIYKTGWWWWWSATEQMADFRSSEYTTPVKTVKLTTGADGKADFQYLVSHNDWGSYFISVSDPGSGHAAGLMSYFDWPGMTGRSADGSADATVLSVKTDKDEYGVGDDVKVSFPSSGGAKAVVNICRGGTVLETMLKDCAEGQTTLTLKASEQMMPNAYVCVSLVQPYGQTANDVPIRLYGVVPVKVSSARSHLTPVISSKDEFSPCQTATINVSEKDGRPMAYTLAVVDEGLLDLTHFATPQPWEAFYAREALGVNMWDVYGSVAGAYGGRIEQLFSVGGDDALLSDSPKAIVNRFTPVVYFDGPFTLRKGGKATHKVDVPNYMGRVRVMVVATDGDAFGQAEKSVKVSKSLMAMGTMPRQIGVGDKATVSATIFAAKAVGDVEVSVRATGGVSVVGAASKTIYFTSDGDQTVTFDIEAGPDEAEASIDIKAVAKAGSADYSTRLKVRKVSQEVISTQTASVAPGKEWKAEARAASGDMKSVLLELGGSRPLNMASRVAQLIEYPHGCAEQTTSKVLAQLCLADFTQLTPEQKSRVEANVNAGIKKLTSHAAADGGVAYWSGGSNSDLFCSAYAYVMYCEAESRGYYVPSARKGALARFLRMSSANWGKKMGVSAASDFAFALYALAADGKAQMGAMNRMRETLAYAKDVPAEAYNALAAAYAASGNADEARRLLVKGQAGTPLRLLAQAGVADPMAATTADALRKKLVSDQWMSTLQVGSSLLSWAHYAKANATARSMEAKVTLGGKELASVKTDKMAWSLESAVSKPAAVAVKNTGDGTISVTMTTTATATQTDVAATSDGLRVEEAMRGDARMFKAGETREVSVRVTNTSGRDLERVAVTYILPAGMEILKVSGEDCSHYDVRDDRVLFYADSLPVGQRASITLTLSATYAGTYYKPAVVAEAMYDSTVGGNTQSGEVVIK